MFLSGTKHRGENRCNFGRCYRRREVPLEYRELVLNLPSLMKLQKSSWSAEAGLGLWRSVKKILKRVWVRALCFGNTGAAAVFSELFSHLNIRLYIMIYWHTFLETRKHRNYFYEKSLQRNFGCFASSTAGPFSLMQRSTNRKPTQEEVRAIILM